MQDWQSNASANSYASREQAILQQAGLTDSVLHGCLFRLWVLLCWKRYMRNVKQYSILNTRLRGWIRTWIKRMQA
jgi:hypothetical protein